MEHDDKPWDFADQSSYDSEFFPLIGWTKYLCIQLQLNFDVKYLCYQDIQDFDAETSI